MQQFVPLTDELLDQDPLRLPGRLVPFSLDYPCHRWLQEEHPEPQGDEHEH